jgi:hypothetical protein
MRWKPLSARVVVASWLVAGWSAGVESARAQQASADAGRADAIAEQRIFAGRTYDAAIPAPSGFLGYGLGQHVATYSAMIPYLERLAAVSDRMNLETHGETYEGRPLYHATISAPENLARLDEIRANLTHLADPRTLASQEQLEAIVRNTPAVVMLVFGTDGAETAGPEAAMHVAYQMVAATDAATRDVLRNLVLIVVPANNPDSNQRAVTWYNAFRVGPDGTADADAAEHHFPWGINSNNRYQIDINRESVWGTQRETRAMVALYRSWNPQVFVDNHGQHPSYTGPWYVEPLHEQLTVTQREWLRRFGEAMAGTFARHGYRYNPWEFGQFDPGYWDTYPNFTGAIAWTTETTGGGNRGLRLQGNEGPLYTLRDGIVQHMIASDLTLRMAAEQRERLLRDFVAYKKTAIDEGRRGAVRAYVLSSRNDPQRLATVVNSLRRNAIEVHRTTRDLRITRARPYFVSNDNGSRASAAVVLPAGSYVLSVAQPESRLLRVLMEPEARFSDEFRRQVEEVRMAAAEGRPSARRAFYDITAWAMPLTYHLDAYEVGEDIPEAALERVEGELRPRGELINPEARYAFLIDYASNAAIEAVARLRRQDVHFRVAMDPFAVGGRDFRAGAVAIFHSENPQRDMGALARELADEIGGIRIVGVDSPITERGPHLGSESLAPVPAGRIGVIMDDPVNPNSFGHIWYTFERIYGVEFTALNFDRLTEADLRKYEVLILPDGNYNSVHSAIATEIAASLRSWLEAGGMLIAIKGGSAWLAREEMGITAARMRRPAQARPALPVVPGAIVRARIADSTNPLAFGYQNEMPVMVWSRLAFDPAISVEAPIRFAEGGRARVSGYITPESLAHLAGTSYVVRDRRGGGTVILFLDDPNFRLFWDGLSRLFFNAVFFGRL